MTAAILLMLLVGEMEAWTILDEDKPVYYRDVIADCVEAQVVQVLPALCSTEQKALHVSAIYEPEEFCRRLDVILKTKTCVYKHLWNCTTEQYRGLLEDPSNWQKYSVVFCRTLKKLDLPCLEDTRKAFRYQACIRRAQWRYLVDRYHPDDLVKRCCQAWNELLACAGEVERGCPRHSSTYYVMTIKVNTPPACVGYIPDLPDQKSIDDYMDDWDPPAEDESTVDRGHALTSAALPCLVLPWLAVLADL